MMDYSRRVVGLMRAIEVLLGSALCVGFLSCSGRQPALPELPDLDVAKFQSAVRAQIEPAYTLARNSPKDAEEAGRLGMILDAHNQSETAAVCYERAHGLDPRAFRWAYYLGNVRMAQGKPAQAIAALREALRIDPDYLSTRVRLADALFADNRVGESEAEYLSAMKRKPDDALAHYGLGRVYASMGDTAKAVEHYRNACGLFPNYGAGHYALALLYRKQGQSEESNRHFRAYEANKTAAPVEDDPLRREVADLNAGAMAHLRRAAALEQSGKIAEAVAEHERALEIDPKLVQAHVNLISLYGRLGQLEKAESYYRSSVSLDPNQADAYYNYGVFLFNRNQYPEAGKQFREALRINPSHAQAHHNLGFLFEQQGNLAKALEEYELATANQADYALAHFHAGRILGSQKRYYPAIVHLLKAITPEDERTPAYLYALAAAYARSGNRVDAVRFARRARTGAAAFGQSELLSSIDKDLAVLERRP